MIHRIGIAIQVFVERQRNALAARMLIHRDETPGFGVIVACPEVIKPCGLVKGFTRVAMPCLVGWVGVALIAKRIKVQCLYDLPAVIGHQPHAALCVFKNVPHLSSRFFADLQPHPIRRVHVARFLPRAAIDAGSLQHDFTVGPRRIQNPLRFFFLCAGFFGSADSSAQRVIAVAHCGAAIAGLHEPVITAPRVADGLRRRLLFDQIASAIPAVGRFVCGCLFFRELIQLVVDVAGLLSVAVFFHSVAYAVVGVAADAGCALGGDAFLGELAVGVVFPAFVCGLAAGFFRGAGQPAFGVALVAVLGQGAAVGFLVADLGQAPGRVVAVVAAGAVGAFDLDEAPGGVVAELGAALAAGQALQAAACVPAGLEGVFALAGKACDELRALAGCVPGGGALAVRAGFAGLAAQRVQCLLD